MFSCYDLFFLPTRGENFGHVVFESFSAGCPVLISDQTPWRALEEKGVGWDLPLSEPERFVSIINRCVEMEHAALAKWCDGARMFAERIREDSERRLAGRISRAVQRISDEVS